MGFNLFKWIGKKASSGVGALARLGKKNLGKIANIGHKVTQVLGTGLNIVDKVPILGSILAPVTRPLTRVLGAVEKGTELAERGKSGIEKAESLVQSAKDAAKSGNISGVIDAGKGLRDVGRGGVSGMREAKRTSVGFGTGVRDSVMGVKGLGRSTKDAFRGLGGS